MTEASRMLEAPEAPDLFSAWAKQQSWSDGLPLIPPTRERVAAMLGDCKVPERVLGVVGPRGGVLSVEVLAANAVMAGCEPGHLPLLIAGAKTLLDPQLNHVGLQCTTNPGGPLLVVNGPVRDEAAIGYGPNALSSASHGNASIARALCLALKNVGGGASDVSHAVLGGPLKRGLLLGENEEQSPWDPLHVRLGYDIAQSVVTAVNVESAINVAAPYTSADGVLAMLALAMQTGLNLHYSAGVLVVCLTPAHARILAAEGYRPDSLAEEVFRRARVPVSVFPAEGNIQAAQWITDGDFVLPTSDPTQILIMVAGRDYAAHSTYFDGWAASGMASTQVLWPLGEANASPDRD
jgi:hypothetical protein